MNGGSVRERLLLGEEVQAALPEGLPFVAPKSTLITPGLPPPQNLEVAQAAEAEVRAEGAVPATIAVFAGRLVVGLDARQLETLATEPTGSVLKPSRPTLATALSSDAWAGTTVSATM